MEERNNLLNFVSGDADSFAAAATAGLSLSTGAGVASNALAGLASSAAQSATDQAISEGTVDLADVAIAGGEGAIVGAFLGKICSSIKGTINKELSSPSNMASIQKDVTKEFKLSGKQLGKSGKASLQREVKARTKHQIEAESSLVDWGKDVSESTVNTVVDIGTDKIEKILEN